MQLSLTQTPDLGSKHFLSDYGLSKSRTSSFDLVLTSLN